MEEFSIISAWWLIPTLVIGSVIGYFIAALMFVSAESERAANSIKY